MTEYSKGEEERKDVFYLETLSMSGQIQSIVIGRFFDRKIETIILAKSTFLSIFHNNDEEDSFEFVDHICVYKEVYCLCTSVQPHSLDCLFVLSIGGEWLLLQWDNSRFFPLATGSLLKAIQPLMKTPEQRRFRIDPTFQWAVSVVPITDNSPRFFTRPSPKQDQKHIPGQNKPIVRISFRALIVADETVFVGVKYDGPDANILSVIKDNWSSALKQFPRKFGFFGPNNKQGYKQENMNAILRNGLENEWKILQTIEQNKKNLCIANADTFIFLEDDDDQPIYIQQRDQQKKHPHSKKNTISLFQSINRVRHLVFTTSMRLEPFPIKKKPFIMSSFQFTTPLNREKDGEVAGPGLSEIERRGRIQLPEYVSSTSQKLEIQQLPINSEMKTTPEISTSETENQNQSCSTAIALVDTPSGLALLSLLFDFEHKNVSLHSFAIAAIPPQASRIMPVLDENRAMKTLKGEDINLLNRVRSADVNILKGVLAKSSEFLNIYYLNTNQSNNNDEWNNIDNNNNRQINQSQLQSNQQNEAINILHTYTTQQQFSNSTFIITFPNKNIHRQNQIISNDDENTTIEDVDSQISTSPKKESNDNQNNDLIIFDQQEIIDNEYNTSNSLSLSLSDKSQILNKTTNTKNSIQNFHPFLIITSLGVSLFTSHLTQLNFIFPISFLQPPMCCLYASGFEQEQKKFHSPQPQLSKNQKKTHRHKMQNDYKSVDKLFIACGRGMIIITNGQVERQNYPFKWFNELAITNGANWYQTKQPNQQQQPLSDNSEIDLLSNNSLLSDETNSKNDINNSQLKIGTQMLFVISASNSSMIVDMNTGTFYDFPGQQADQKDVGEGQPEDFQMNPTNVSQVCPIPNYSYSPYHQMEDKFILGVGNGRTGALHSIGIGHRLQTIMQGKWYEKDLPALFTTKAYSGAKMHSLLLVEEEQIVDINNQLEKIKVKKQSKSESHIKQQTLYPYKKAQVLSVGNNIYTSYSSSIFELHEDVVEPIDSFIVGIDTTKKTLALGPAQGAFIQVTTSEIRVIPTLNYFACPVYQTKTQQQQQQQLQKNSTSLVKSVSQDEQQFAGIATQIDYEIRSEQIGYDIQHGISWQAPILFSEEQCWQYIYNLRNNQQQQNNNQQQQDQQIMPIDCQQRVVFECACITDNLIALSYKCIVFVLIWNPSKPRIPTSKTIQNQSTKYQSSKILQLSAFVYPIATLCFPSPVKSLNAQTICTRSFLVVGCDQPPAVFLLRLDTLQVAKDSEDKRRQLWKDGEQLLKKLKYQLTYPPVQRPNHSLVIQNGVKELNNQDDKHQIHIGEQNQSSILITENISVTEHRKDKDTIINKQYRFVEVMSGSHQFVEVQYTQNAIMTRILDLFPYDKPEQILLTTFNRQCRLFTQEEIDANDRKSLYGEQTNSQTSLIIQSSEKQILLTKKTYERNEGAVLMIAGIHGQLSTSIIPLSAILDFLPEQPSKENKLKKTQFFFPSLISTIKLYPERIKITDDDSNVYIFGDRVSVLNWNDRACKILWNDLECAGIIHSLQPMRIKEEDAQLQSIKDESSNLNEETSLLNNSQHVSGSNTTSKTPVPHPTLAWIDYVQKRLTFGAIDRRNIVIRDVKDIPSQPIAIAHIPTLHAIAVLCREPSQNPYQIKSKDDIQDSDVKDYFNQEEKNEREKKLQQQNQYNENNNTDNNFEDNLNYRKSLYFDGLGLDISGVDEIEQQTYLPFHDIFHNYLQENEITKNNNNKIPSVESPLINQSPPEMIDQEEINKKKFYSQLKLQIQYFHESIPDKDTKGDPFIDIASDWFIQSHQEHFKDYRMKRIPPYKQQSPKVNLCYSPKTNFSIAFPDLFSPMNIMKAINKQYVRLSVVQRKQSQTSNSGQQFDDYQQIFSLINNNNLEIDQNLPLPTISEQSLYLSQFQPQSTSAQTKSNNVQQSNQNIINLSQNSLEKFIESVTNSFLIVLYDETEMRLRIGELNLSNLRLDFGNSSNGIGSSSYQQQQQFQIWSEKDDQCIKQSSFVMSTQLYNFFTMVCVTIPTQQGFNEIMKIRKSTFDELEEASNEMGYDKKQLEYAEKIYNELDEKELRKDAQQIQQIINLQKLQESNTIKSQSYSNHLIEAESNSFQNSQTDIEQNQQFDENKYIKRQQQENNQNKQNNFQNCMQTNEFHDRYARSLLCVVGRESSIGQQRLNKYQNEQEQDIFQQQSNYIQDIDGEIFYRSMVTDIFIIEVVRLRHISNTYYEARQLLEQNYNQYQTENNGLNQIESNNNNIHFTDDQIQSALDKTDSIKMSYPGNSTSAMTTIYDKLQLLNVSLKIHKRIRVLGGVQGVFSHPSTLVVLNGCHCFVFVLGPRYDDSEISTISKVYNFAGNVNVVEQTTDSLKDENIFEKNKYEYQNPHKINNNEQFDEQQINDEHCTCTTPLFTEKGEIFPTLPQHAHIQSICNVYDTTNNIFKKSKIQYTQKRQTYKYSNESSILVSRPLESYALTSPFTFAVRQVAQIIAPSPITSVALQQTQYRPDPAPFPRKVSSSSVYSEQSTFRGLTINHKQQNLIPAYLQLQQSIRINLNFAPVGFAFVDMQFGLVHKFNNDVRFMKQKFCVYDPQNVQSFEELLKKQKRNQINKIKQKKDITNKKKKIKKKNQIKSEKSFYQLQQENLKYLKPVIQSYVKKQDNNMIELIEGSLIPLAFAQRRCRHCSKVYKTNKQISNGSKMKENINREETLSDQTSSSSDFLTDDIEPQISAYEQLKSSSKHPHFTGSDLAAAAGIYLKHRPNDLVKCAAEFGQKISLIAQAYTPTLIIDTAPLGINQYGIVCDYEILIYTLVPNPLYKRMKKQRIRSITGNNNNSNNEFEYLPMCAVLSARIPNIQHFSFIHRCSSGVSSIFSGSNKALFQKLYHNLELLQQQKIKVNSSKGDLSKLTGQNEQVNTQQVQKIDSKQSIAEFDENIEDTLYAEDFDDANMQHLHNDNNYQQNLVNKSPKSTLQNLPSIPSFIFFSRSGSIKKAIPTFFTKIPLNNLFITLHIYSVLDQEFGDIWRGSQIEVFRDFNQVEQQTNRLVFIEQAVREYISTGRIARRPPAPLDDQMPPIYSLKNGRFIESQTLFGLSPQPISVDSTSWKNLSFQNFVKSLEHLMLYSQYLTHQRLVIRELIRRFIQQYKILKLPEGTKDEIQEKNHDIILKKSVYAISSVIGRTAFVLQSDVSDDEGLKMRRLYKQFRLGMRQLTLALKYQDKKFIKRTKEEFLDSLNREVSLKNQYWYKYRNQIFNSNIGIETNLNILFKDDPLISENIPKGQAAKPIKISSQFMDESSEYTLDLYRISEKIHFNRNLLENNGLKLNINNLFKSLIKENKRFQIDSKSKKLYITIHQNQSNDQDPLPSDDDVFVSQLQQENTPNLFERESPIKQKQKVLITQQQQQNQNNTNQDSTNQISEPNSNTNSSLQRRKSNNNNSQQKSLSPDLAHHRHRHHHNDIMSPRDKNDSLKRKKQNQTEKVQSQTLKKEHKHDNEKDKKYHREKSKQNNDKENDQEQKEKDIHKQKIHQEKEEITKKQQKSEQNDQTYSIVDYDKSTQTPHKSQSTQDNEQNLKLLYNFKSNKIVLSPIVELENEYPKNSDDQWQLYQDEETKDDIFIDNTVQAIDEEKLDSFDENKEFFSDKDNEKENESVNYSQYEHANIRQLQLQRAQFSQHFPHYNNHTYEDIDYSENIENQATQSSQQQNDEQQLNESEQLQSNQQASLESFQQLPHLYQFGSLRGSPHIISPDFSNSLLSQNSPHIRNYIDDQQINPLKCPQTTFSRFVNHQHSKTVQFPLSALNIDVTFSKQGLIPQVIEEGEQENIFTDIKDEYDQNFEIKSSINSEKL